MSNLFEVFVIAALIVVNGALSGSETAMVSARRARLQARAESGSSGARTALALLNAPNQFLATIQIGISLIGVLAGAFGGATLAGYLADWLDNSATLEPYSSFLALAIVVALISYFTLVIGELVPKRLALRSPEPIATKVARPIASLARVARPAVYLLSASTELVLRLLRVKPSDEPQVTVEEITMLIREGAQLGVFQAAEQEIAESVFELTELRAAEIMAPRPKIVWIDLEDDHVKSFETIAASPHARFPVAEGGLDHVIGILHVKQLWSQSLAGVDVSLRRDLNPPVFVPESASVLNVMETFRSSGQQIALVVDEFGGVQGLITVTDILETIVGELRESESGPLDGVVRRDDDTWLMDGTLPIHEVRDVLGLDDELPGEAQGNFQTLGGFVMSELERIPRESDRVDRHGFRFEVVDMDGNRVDKVLVERRAAPPATEGAAPDERQSTAG